MRKTKTPDPNRKQACAEGDKHVKKCELRTNHAQTQTQTQRERETDRHTHPHTHTHTHTPHTHTVLQWREDEVGGSPFTHRFASDIAEISCV